jgi:hypothetical protein
MTCRLLRSLLLTLYLRNPHRNHFGVVRSADRAVDNLRPKMGSKKSCMRAALVIAVGYTCSPHIAEASNPVLSVPAQQRAEPKIWIVFRSNYPFKQKWSSNSLSRCCAQNTNLWQMLHIFKRCVWVFSSPYSTVVTTSIPTAVKPFFVLKKFPRHVNPFLWKSMLSIAGF